ncbi:MAG: hemerythrin domain-containing protein [Bacteriovorax sp.]
MPRKSPRSAPMNREYDISFNNHFNIIDILLLDHSYLKECVDVLMDDAEDKKVKLKYAKCFLDTLKKHSTGAKKALYAPLEEVKNFRSHILKSEIENGIVDAKVRTLSSNIAGARTLSEEMEAELKVLAEIVDIHLESEEAKLFPKMQNDIDSKILNQMGYQFMAIRQFSEKDLKDSELRQEIPYVTSAIPAQKFINTTHEYFSSGHV